MAPQPAPSSRPNSGREGGGGRDGPRVTIQDFTIISTISKGSFGTVFRVERKADGRVYALKQINLEGMNRAEREESIDEARVLASLKHKHVVRYYDCFIDGKMLNIVMSHASGGTIHHKIKELNGKRMPEDQIWKYFIQSLLGLHHIHMKKVIHRDIKSLNLFLDHEDVVKVGDLGIAKVLSSTTFFAKTVVGTPYYLSPELCEDKPYNERSDVWALGVVLYEMCTGKHPFDATNEGALIRKIMRGTYAPIQHRSPACTEVVSLCLTLDPKRRPDCAALLRHPVVSAKMKELRIDPSDQGDQHSSASTYGPGGAHLPREEHNHHRPSSGRMERGPPSRGGGDMVEPPQPYAEQEGPNRPPPYFTRPMSASAARDHRGAGQAQHRGASGGYREEDAAYESHRREKENEYNQAASRPPQQWPPREPGAGAKDPRDARNDRHAPYASAKGHEDPYAEYAMERLAVNPDPRAMAEERDQRAEAARQNQRAMHQDNMHSLLGGGAAGGGGGRGGRGGGVGRQHDQQGRGDQMRGEPQYKSERGYQRDYAVPEEHYYRATYEGGRGGGRDARPQSAAAGNNPNSREPQYPYPRDQQREQYPSAPRNYQEMPAAGARQQPRPQSATMAPFACHPQDARVRTTAQEQAQALRDAKYTAPQFGRKRCDDIGITGPNLRDAGGSRGGAAGGASGRGSSIATSTTATNIFATGFHG